MEYNRDLIFFSETTGEIVLHKEKNGKANQHSQSPFNGVALGTVNNHRIYRLGDETWPPTRKICNRIINKYALHFVLEGKCIFNGVLCEAGDAFLCVPEQPHTICVEGDEPFHNCWLIISRWYSSEFWNTVAKKFKNGNTCHVQQDAFREISKFLEIIFNEAATDEKILSYITFIISLFAADAGISEGKNAKSTAISDAENLILQNAKNYIDTYFCDNISVKAVAKYVHISSSQLFRIFKKELGISPQNYILTKRMEEASKYLNSDFDIKIRDIAVNVGYSSYSNFEKYFKLYFGCSPKEYRDNIKVKE